ncbi:long-chain-fatty-acid--coa ligase 5 [Anaeramoeba ignava]|uniref:Long-chain-fatty-acid--coa ligase 5 n=1 Tax=Anaeramoeba ignava TaxID=1746090 RepID=A0A9Q0LPH0_ANAIG|nr:long-chain-fatty-acid--coa ligase 5 [Anaeramoeba ignava]
MGITQSKQTEQIIQKTPYSSKNKRIDGYIPEQFPRIVEKEGQKFYSWNYQQNGETIYRSNLAKDGLLSKWNESVSTLYENLEVTTKSAPDNQLFGTRKYNKTTKKYEDYEWKTYKEFGEERTYFGSGLINYGIKKDDRIGIFAKNRYEWVLTEHSAYAYSFLLVPLYHTFGIPNILYIINHSECKVVITEMKYVSKLKQICEECKTLKSIIVLDDPEEDIDKFLEENEDIKFLNSHNINIYKFNEIFESGKQKQYPHQPNKADDLCSLIYTSGTTSQPKGVLTTHKNLISTIAGFYYIGYDFSDNESYYSYLPLSHVYERALEGTMISISARIGFSSGDNTKLVEEMQLVKPTIFTGVPRIYSKVYDKVTQGIKKKSIFSQYLFQVAYEAKKKAIENGESYDLWDKLVFNKTKQLLGGRIELLISGSAALLPLHQEFFKILFTPHFVQGWGLTETASGGTVQNHEDTICNGVVGPPLCSCEIKLESVPELNYNVNDKPNPRGELLVRGPNVLEGYYKNPEATNEVIIDGWFHTGDIGEALPNGHLKVIDRKKNIFKLSQGEYVAPDVLEGLYSNSQYVMQLMVYGNSQEDYLIGIAVPEKEIILDHFKNEKQENENSEEFFQRICQEEKIKELILKDMEKIGRGANRFGFEILRNIIIETEPFSVENDLLTTTMKLRRKAIENHYKKQLLDLYLNKSN